MTPSTRASASAQHPPRIELVRLTTASISTPSPISSKLHGATARYRRAGIAGFVLRLAELQSRQQAFEAGGSSGELRLREGFPEPMPVGTNGFSMQGAAADADETGITSSS